MNIKSTPLVLALAGLSAFSALSPVALAAPIDRVINKLDTDSDGQVSREEFAASDRSMVKRMDSNGDGVVTLDEINARIEEHQAEMARKADKMKSRVQEHFAEADSNGDGIVTKEEAQSAMFARIDADGDGFLTAQEMFEARPKHRHAPGAGKDGPRGGRHAPPDEV